MGIIEDKVNKMFTDFEKHGDYNKLIEEILDNGYSYGWQREMYDSFIKAQLKKIRNGHMTKK